MAAVSGFSFVWFFGFGLLFVPRVRLPFPMEHDGEFHGNGTNQRRPETESKKQATKKTINRTGVVFFCFFFFTAPSERWKWTTTGRSDRRPVPGPKSGRCCLCCCACSSTNCSPDLPARCHLCGRANRFGPIFSLKKNKGSDGFP